MTKIVTIGQTEMIRVGRDYPCPICGKPDWCLVFADQSKAVCARKIDQTNHNLVVLGQFMIWIPKS